MFRLNDIELRKSDLDDANKLLDLKKESWLFTHRTTIINNIDQLEFIDNLSSEPHSPKELLLIARMLNLNGISCVDVGMFFITNIDYVHRSADVSWAVFKDYRRKGIGSKIVKCGCAVGFQILNLNRLNCEILADNLASTKCALINNFVIEGMKRQSVFKLGKYIDSQVLGLLADQFECDKLTPSV